MQGEENIHSKREKVSMYKTGRMLAKAEGQGIALKDIVGSLFVETFGAI
jgi:hypothetical protein